MWSRQIVVSLLFVSRLVACSCASYEPVKACQIVSKTPVVFRGRVIDDNHDPKAGFAQMTLYRLEILEAFKGVPPGITEVFIDPASGTSCYAEFSKDREYLFYLGNADRNFAAMTISGKGGGSFLAKQIPSAWAGLDKLPVYMVGVCSPTKSVKEDDPDLTYLRSLAQNRPSTGWVEGRAVQNLGWPWVIQDFVPSADTVITLTSSLVRQTLSVQPDGMFRIDKLAPGKYTVSAFSKTFGEGKLHSEVEVPPGGCAVSNATFDTRSTISGKVFDPSGRPGKDIRLELGQIQADGKVRVIPMTWANTDQQGKFVVSKVPLGRIVLAANLNGVPTVDMPFDPFYLPGTYDLSSARIFDVRPGQQISGVSLHLPPPLPFGTLLVNVNWPDGSPAIEGARAFAETNGARAAFGRASATSSKVYLKLALGRRYTIRVDWLNAKPGNFLLVDGSGPKVVNFSEDGQTVELALKSSRPQ